MKTQFIAAILVIGIICGCSNEDNLPIQEQIDQYLSANNLTAERTASGLHYIIEDPGQGTAHPGPSSTVRVNYIGKLLNGDQFDANQNISFSLNQVIAGWREGIPIFKKGGKGTLIIPPSLGYGATGAGSIPPNAVIVFDIELLDFN